MDKAALLGELEDVIRTMPPKEMIGKRTDDSILWLSRAGAVMNLIGGAASLDFIGALVHIHDAVIGYDSAVRVMRAVNQARFSLRLQTLGPVNSAIGVGEVFDYFDEVRQIMETAQAELFFVDPYMGADFVGRYLPYVKPGVGVRLLTQRMIPQLLPALQLFKDQHGTRVEARASSSGDLHDRWLFVDNAACYQSGASFKDGAKKSPTTLTQVQDVFAVVHQQYQKLWQAGAVVA